MDDRNDRQANMKALFKGQSERAYIFGKLEKLAHAVILLTSQSDIERGLVERLEMCVLDSVREAAVFGSNPDQSSLISTLLELLSLIRLSGTAGILTQSNTSILVEEYIGVLTRLSAPTLQGIVLRREELLSGSEGGIEEGPGLWRELPSSIDDLFGLRQAHGVDAQGQSMNEDKRLDKGQKKTTSHTNPPKGQTKSAQAKDTASSRSQAILAVVKTKGVVSIRDVADVVTGCSEKTIQRELLALVEKGVIKKEGERRWSTYRLA